MGFNIRILEIFLTLSEKLNFRETSNIHHMECSTLSRMISRLEYQMGVLFFVRSRTKVELTEQGKLFRRYAKKTVNDYNNIHHKLNKTSAVVEGVITIASAPTLASSLLPKITKAFMGKYPNVDFNIIISTSSQYVSQRLDEEKYDFSLQSTGGVPDSRTVHQYISESPLMLVRGQGDKEVTSLQELNNKHFLRSEYPDLHLMTENIFYKHALKPKKETYFNGHELICDELAENGGYAFLPKVIIDNSAHKEKLVFCSPEEELPMANIGFRMKKLKHYTTLKQAFWDFLSELEFPYPCNG